VKQEAVQIEIAFSVLSISRGLALNDYNKMLGT